MYGADIFYEDALNELYPVALDEAVKEAEMEVVGYPKVNVDHVGHDGVQMTATLGVKPEVKLGQYKGLEAPKDTVEVTDADVDGEMQPLIARATTQESVERPVENGDTAVIDFEGFKEGVPFDGVQGLSWSVPNAGTAPLTHRSNPARSSIAPACIVIRLRSQARQSIFQPQSYEL